MLEQKRKSLNFAINLVDLEPKQYMSSTTKQQSGFLLNQPIQPT